MDPLPTPSLYSGAEKVKLTVCILLTDKEKQRNPQLYICILSYRSVLVVVIQGSILRTIIKLKFTSDVLSIYDS